MWTSNPSQKEKGKTKIALKKKKKKVTLPSFKNSLQIKICSKEIKKSHFQISKKKKEKPSKILKNKNRLSPIFQK